MDSNSSSFLLNSSNFHSVFYQDKHDDGIIDLGLSLGTVQHDAYHSSANCMSSSPCSLFQFFNSFSYLSELNFDTPIILKSFTLLTNYNQSYMTLEEVIIIVNILTIMIN